MSPQWFFDLKETTPMRQLTSKRIARASILADTVLLHRMRSSLLKWLRCWMMTRYVCGPCAEAFYSVFDLNESLLFNQGDTREERVFRMWINSLGLPLPSALTDSRPGAVLPPNALYLNDLYNDMKDGIALLMVEEEVGAKVDWKKKVNTKRPLNKVCTGHPTSPFYLSL